MSTYCSIQAEEVTSKTKRISKDGEEMTEKITVAKITGGYVVTISKETYGDKEHKEDGMTFFSETNPLEEKKEVKSSESMDGIIKGLV